MITILWICFALLVVSMGMVLIRLEKGPTNLDRAVALDVITACAVGVVVVIMALTGRVDLLPLLVVLTSVGFIGTTTIARFSRAESISQRRVLTSEEAAGEAEPELADEDAPVHPDASGDADEDDEAEITGQMPAQTAREQETP
ncbi:monovalent cation/H+ antiporter complex subunit F [Propionimicrobium sp. PCR01-08-3]|uniref:monovalent cation/H+ antiporter complex subunit F n=1 Tax=Propionimicrobium sp. PCR01-08-3 TaxID=3052086 RepID=UPI00255C4947|nr:monovalent cation/H+ antiporter complex subunit F [Propionimicrobium sp. PCR01-08-3]WIY82764.1 monovalent cation/H+ antiporter complex subunit F [Propionimicrobium sp. PCR01-08-3]